jgi:UDP-N-acetylmuramoyl-L-alanyl-D-glutamate--2,6-diaminopimelate ligase
MSKGRYITIINRTEAIKYAINMANKNDIIVLAGKGHETYQEINGVKHHYDEREIIKEVI